jgi:DNA-binding PadR family transcriptional regulator
MREIKLDKLDIKLLKCCKEKSGGTIAEIIEPFLATRASRTLYDRLSAFEAHGLIKVDRTAFKGRALCYITDAGKDVAKGREETDHHGTEGSS